MGRSAQYSAEVAIKKALVLELSSLLWPVKYVLDVLLSNSSNKLNVETLVFVHVNLCQVIANELNV